MVAIGSENVEAMKKFSEAFTFVEMHIVFTC